MRAFSVGLFGHNTEGHVAIRVLRSHRVLNIGERDRTGALYIRERTSAADLIDGGGVLGIGESKFLSCPEDMLLARRLWYQNGVPTMFITHR